MINNDILRRVRFALDLSDPQLLKIIQAGFKLRKVPPAQAAEVDQARIGNWLKKENDEAFEQCPDNVLSAFLDGLVRHLRGPSDRPVPVEPDKLDNNLVLKKLRIALSLRSEDVVADIQRGGGALTESELGAFFRAPGHKKYKACGDQMLRRFLQGVVLRMRPDKA